MMITSILTKTTNVVILSIILIIAGFVLAYPELNENFDKSTKLELGLTLIMTGAASFSVLILYTIIVRIFG